MPHPLLHLMATRPHLLLEHAEAYAELASAEAESVTASFKRSAILNAAGFVGLLVAVLLIGVALLLLALTPMSEMHWPWLLWVVPLPPLVMALACLVGARTSAPDAAFSNLRRQLKADMAMLKEVNAP